ncbi:MAG: response regulator [Thermodesulfobacteriota bacterium]
MIKNKSTYKTTILLIDDKPENLAVLVEYLESSDFEVVVSQSGESGLTRADYVRPDLILLDVMMPGIDGFETCRRLKKSKETSDIPVIFMTALTSIDDTVQGFKAGGVDYITKPVHLREALARIKTHVKICQLQNDLRQSEEQCRNLADAAFEGIVIIEGELIINANQALLDLFGYTIAELLGKSPIDFVAPKDREMVKNKVASKVEEPYETQCIRKDGTFFPVEVQARMFLYNGRERRASAIRDLTEKKRAEEEIKALKGILPFCSYCKKIRDDKGYWEQIEVYVHKYSDADISHSVCPDCAKQYFPDEYEEFFKSE